MFHVFLMFSNQSVLFYSGAVVQISFWKIKKKLVVQMVIEGTNQPSQRFPLYQLYAKQCAFHQQPESNPIWVQKHEPASIWPAR